MGPPSPLWKSSVKRLEPPCIFRKDPPVRGLFDTNNQTCARGGEISTRYHRDVCQLEATSGALRQRVRLLRGREWAYRCCSLTWREKNGMMRAGRKFLIRNPASMSMPSRWRVTRTVETHRATHRATRTRRQRGRTMGNSPAAGRPMFLAYHVFLSFEPS